MSRKSEIPFSSPALQQLAGELLDAARIAAQRAVDHELNSGSSRLPDLPNSVESIIQKRLSNLPVTAKKRINVSRPQPDKPHGRASQIDKSSPLSALDQLARQSERPLLDWADIEAEGFMLVSGTPFAPSLTHYRKLHLKVSKLHCKEETTGGGSDEITLDGISISANGTTKNLPALFNEKEFDDGDKVNFNPAKNFATFTFEHDNFVTVNGVSYPLDWPRRYSVTFLMAEIDNGGFPQAVKDLFDELKTAAIAEVKAAIAGAVGSVGGPLVAAIVAAAVYIGGKITDWLISEFTAFLIDWWEDDVFLPRSTSITLSGPIMYSKSAVQSFKQHGGDYRLHFEWKTSEPFLPTTLEAGVGRPAVLQWNPLSNSRNLRMEVFARGLDRNIYRTFQTNSQWSHWGITNLENAASFKSSPVATSWRAGRLELFALGEDSNIYQNSLHDYHWSGWNNNQFKGYLFQSAPAAVSRKINYVDLFAVGMDGRIYNFYWNGSAWSSIRTDLPFGEFISAPAVTDRTEDKLDVVALGKDRKLYISTWPNNSGKWSDWSPIGNGTFTSSPAICNWNDDRLHLFARGDDRRIWHAYYETGIGWKSWFPIGEKDTFSSGPAVFSRQAGQLDLFAIGDDQRMYRRVFDGHTWSDWFSDFKLGHFA